MHYVCTRCRMTKEEAMEARCPNSPCPMEIVEERELPVRQVLAVLAIAAITVAALVLL